ncbi:DNA methylase [Calothrix sp. FACHB-1219]|uniref:PmeII family type II restriction endonuclease n=1 Tax=unclassified Calothrix TaxID=2619626 RepID=UPI0016865B0D|nr:MULTISPECIES: PmeII family type II restriction endonuclease [unclassified Calothrix]MBD2202589.1 DNA methylase [Calothrix sp. FACHB-168]MBD2217821.1 DNA methylase [Calothrix sp. FACHB-1219]
MVEASLNISLESEEILIQDLGSVDKDNPQSWKNQVILGDCLEVLQKLPSASVDLIITSPPYADSRKKTYGGISPDEYTDWFLTVALELKRVLKPEGSFILNIKEKVVNGERHPYVLNLILGMQNQGWLWTEEYIWHKKNSYPGKWSNRFRDSWERCLHFNKQKKFKMYQESVMVPMGDWAKSRLKNLSETDKRRDTSKVESGFGKNISNWVERKMAYPTNVLHLATECGNKNHSAAFPKTLPSWFIKLFTDFDDVVLDPFAGSGTSCVAAKELGRNYIGIEIKQEYCGLAAMNIKTAVANSQVVKNNKQSNEELNVVDRDYTIYHDYLIQQVLTPFYDKRFEKLSKLKLKDVIKRKNPYLFKAKNIELAQDLVASIITAFLSSQEETIFGNLLEGFAIHISQSLYGGFKSKLNSVDLEFQRNETYYIVGIKSGNNWGNSDQISKMKDNFKKAKQLLIKQGITSNIVAINGCMYGKDSNPLKEDLKDPDKTYFKYAGQEFWEFISGDANLYQEMIVPIGEEAKKKDEIFQSTLNAKVNEMTFEFIQYFTINGHIDWIRLVDYVSKKGDFKLEPISQQMTLELEAGDSDLEEPLDLADALDFEE